MKKTERITRFGLCGCMLMLMLCVIGCKKEDKINDLFPQELAAQLPQTTNYNLHKFVISEELNYYSPVVRWQVNGQDLFMLVDTGAYNNFLFLNGIKKGLKGLIITDILKSPDMHFSVEINKLNYIIDPSCLMTVGYEVEFIDGLLGLSWMKRYNNIVFDYINHRIDYNQPPITDYDIPMNWNDVFGNGYAIPFTFNGKEMYGCIDTGCYCTYVNLGIIGEEKGDDGVYVVNDFSIGNIKYENMTITQAKEGAMDDFAKNNILGYSCFKDHVIQLDFKNNVFRIK